MTDTQPRWTLRRNAHAVAPHRHMLSTSTNDFLLLTDAEADDVERALPALNGTEHGRSRFDCDGLREASRTIASPGASSWMLAAADEIDRLRFTAPSADTADLIERLHAAADTATGPMIRLLLAEAADTLAAASGEHGDTVSVPKADWDALVEAVDKGAGRMGHRWIVPIGDRATALVGASRRQAATEGGAS